MLDILIVCLGVVVPRSWLQTEIKDTGPSVIVVELFCKL